jgi:very-short-patch-repair endonuclease
MFLMFMGPYSDGGDWSDSGIHGIARFRDRVWRLFDAEAARKERPAETDAALRREFLRILHLTIREVTGDLEKFHFNTALSRLMEFSNFLQGSAEKLSEPDAREALKIFSQLLAPFAPHMGEELWERFITSPPIPLSREGEGETESKAETRSPGYIFERARELRKSATDAEELLWKCLRDRALEGFKFRRQHPIKRYIADFFCQEANLVIEVEGSVHDERNQEEYDKIRKESLEGLGCTVLRFRNEDVLSDVEGVLRTVLDALPAVPLSPKGEGVSRRDGGEVKSIFDCGWPGYDPKRIETETIPVVVQVNGRKQGKSSRGRERRAARPRRRENRPRRLRAGAAG